jgi:hypothetical protein
LVEEAETCAHFQAAAQFVMANSIAMSYPQFVAFSWQKYGDHD